MSFNLEPAASFAASFCTDCGSILTFPSHSTTVECFRCGVRCSGQGITESVRVTKSAEKIDFSAMLNGENDDDDQRATVTEECAECGHMTAYFRTLQLRSADEGQTIFYQCVECGHTWNQNS